MKPNDNFSKLFGNTPVLGMIHLARDFGEDCVMRALHELEIFELEGVDGAIIENYHSHGVCDVEDTLREASKARKKVVLGVNVLPNEFRTSMSLASQYGASFVQLDYVAGKYRNRKFKESPIELNLSEYERAKSEFPEIVVLGGVWPKYYHPVSDSLLEIDLRQGMSRAEAIVVTGEGTGQETPYDKIRTFRMFMGQYPLIVGAGLTPQNAYKQLMIADGAIVGTTFKPDEDTYRVVDRKLVRDFMNVVKKCRVDKASKRGLC